MELQRVGGMLGRMVIGLFWLLLVPLVFLTLYAAAELQIAAKNALPQSTSVANIAVIGHSKIMRDLNKRREATIGRINNLTQQKADDHLRYTQYKHRLRILLMAIAADDPVDQRLNDCADRDKTVACFERTMTSAHRRLLRVSDPRAAQLKNQILDAENVFLQFLMLSDTTNESKDRIADETKALQNLNSDIALQSNGDNAPIFAASKTFDEMERNIPWFKLFFVLPDGAVIGLFAGVMGAIGAVVFSLFGRMQGRKLGDGLAAESLTLSYVTRPLLGALAGFIVYFAVSAGSGALLEQGAASHVSAGSALSTATLATLGLFAGLAAENALQWLTDKARGLFKS